MKTAQIIGMVVTLLIAAGVSMTFALGSQHKASTHRNAPAGAGDKTPKPATTVSAVATRPEDARIVKTDEEWRKLLTPGQYRVLRDKGTEIAFTGKDWNQHAKGTYRCAACDYVLFNSEQKFDSGTGWPSFWQPAIASHVSKDSDTTLGMVRDEVTCARCGGHLGHVFDDGPAPTGLRYCINSVALKFVPAK